MRTTSTRARRGLIALLAAVSITAAACGDDDDDSSAATDAPTATEAAGATEMSEATTMDTTMDTGMSEATTMDTEMDGETTMTTGMSETSMGESEMLQPSGPACSSIPASGEGSFGGMADDPAATAASNNPELTTLVTAVQAAGLVDTLNGPGPFTIFAPTNSAFAKIPAADLDAVLADPTGALTDVLTLHVVSGERLSSADLAGMDSLEAIGGELTIAADGDALTVDAGGGPATVVCADIPTSNATVHIIDTVLLPAG
jgi:transforming growth factor-beta-induced protein